MKRGKTPTFIIELPLAPDPGQATRLAHHLEAGRALYNALLGEAMKRLSHMRADPAWQQARVLPRSQKHQRANAFRALREQYHFSEYALHDAAKRLRCAWIAEHIDSTMAQTLASRAYHAANKLCLGQANHVRFKSRGKGLDSVEGKRNDTGLRFLLQDGEEGNDGLLIWNGDRIPARINWKDEVIAHGLRRRIKYCRLVRRNASSERAKGADCHGKQYSVQLIVEGTPLIKPKNTAGTGAVGVDLGPSTIAIVPHEGMPRLLSLCAELAPDAARRRRLQRKLDRKRRANNPEHYDSQGRVNPRGKRPRRWKESRGYQRTRRKLATAERRLAAHGKSLHGRLKNDIVRAGHDIRIEAQSYKGWQKVFGRSVNLRAPGMLVGLLRRTGAHPGAAVLVHEIPTQSTKLSQLCHACGRYTHKPLSQRVHCCSVCGLGSNTVIQRDLYSAWLLSEIDPLRLTFPSGGDLATRWQRMEMSLLAALEELQQRAKEWHLPRSISIPGARARQPERSLRPAQEHRMSPVDAS